MLDLDPTRERQSDVNQPRVESTDAAPRLHGIMAGVLVLAVGLAAGTVFFSAKAKATELRQLDGQYQTLADQLASTAFQDIEKRALEVNTKAKILLERSAVPDRWVTLLEELQRVTSPGVEILSLSMDQRNLIRVEGRTNSHELVAGFLATLVASTKFEDVTLISVNQPDDATATSLQFTVGLSFVDEKSLSV